MPKKKLTFTKIDRGTKEEPVKEVVYVEPKQKQTTQLPNKTLLKLYYMKDVLHLLYRVLRLPLYTDYIIDEVTRLSNDITFLIQYFITNKATREDKILKNCMLLNKTLYTYLYDILEFAEEKDYMFVTEGEYKSFRNLRQRYYIENAKGFHQASIMNDTIIIMKDYVPKLVCDSSTLVHSDKFKDCMVLINLLDNKYVMISYNNLIDLLDIDTISFDQIMTFHGSDESEYSDYLDLDEPEFPDFRVNPDLDDLLDIGDMGAIFKRQVNFVYVNRFIEEVDHYRSMIHGYNELMMAGFITEYYSMDIINVMVTFKDSSRPPEHFETINGFLSEYLPNL